MEQNKCTLTAEIDCCSSQREAEGPINATNKTTSMRNRRASLDASETASSSSSQKTKGKGKGVACKRRNPSVLVRRTRAANVAAIGLPLGMSFAAVMAQVLYRRDAAAEMSPSHLSSMCTSAIKESLASVFGDKLDGLTENFEQSFESTLSTLQLIYKSPAINEGNKLNSTKKEISSSKLNKGDGSRDIVIEDGQSRPLPHPEIQDQSIIREEVRDNFHMDSIARDLSLQEQPNQMVCFSPTSSEPLLNNPAICTFEKSIVEQCRSNDLKTIELGLAMKKLKLKETELALSYNSNDLKRSKLAMEASKTSFRAEKFKNKLEDARHGELNKKCIDCLIAGLLIMSSSLFYGAYVYNYEKIYEAAESCAPTEDSFSWWTPKSMVRINSSMHVFLCQVRVVSRMVFGFLMIIAVAYLLFQRSATLSSQTMPITFVLLMLGIGCGYCGKLCVDTLGGSGYTWLIYWEIICLLHFLSLCCTPILYRILHGPVTTLQTTKGNTVFSYWIRRFVFYVALLVFLPLCCGLMPFASLGQWKDHFMLRVLGFYGSDSSEW